DLGFQQAGFEIAVANECDKKFGQHMKEIMVLTC
ncbi:MAG: hypothetical protein RIQ74_1176, partial [Pseudomonadota bacterium]